MSSKKFYITTPIYYSTAKPHIGHTYTTLSADITARFMRLLGYDVHFLTGVDEHGQKVATKADSLGLSPKQLADDMASVYPNVWKKYDLSYTHFIRTTDSHHEEFVKQMVQKAYDNGYIYKGKYSGLYCEGCEEFLTAKGLTDKGLCPNHLTKPLKIEEENYFFKLTAFKEKLLEYYEQHSDFIQPKERLEEIKNIVKDYLFDFSVSRPSVAWGIPFPLDTKHTVYVWFDALFNYASYAEGKNIWPADIQFMGKDIIKFHAIYWPAMLMACDMEIPRTLFAHGYFTVADQKISKTIGNVIDPEELIEKYHRDAIVFYLFNEVKFGSDGNFSQQQMEERYKTELANKYGNLLNRILMLANKNDFTILKGELTAEEKELLKKVRPIFIDHISNQNYKEALETAWQILHHANKYVDETKPWEILKLDKAKGENILYSTCEMIRVFALLTLPFFPQTNTLVLKTLGLDYEQLLTEGKWQTLFDQQPNFELKEKTLILYKPLEPVA